MTKPKLLVVDGMNYLFRGFYALNHYKTEASDINYVAAIRGFLSIVMADLKFLKATHCAVVFDRPGKNFRHRLYPEYKANREDTEILKELRKQIKHICALLRAMGIKVYGIRGQEGDDLVASLAVTCHDDNEHVHVYIGSRDKDFASLVRKRISLLHPQKEILNIKGVRAKWGVKPSQMVDYLMLLGDGVDNIPGVYKVGPTTAASILNKHGSIKEWLPTKKTPALHKNVEAVRKFFPTSRKLITLKTDCFPNMRLEKLVIRPFDSKELHRLCKDLGFNTTYKQLKTMLSNL